MSLTKVLGSLGSVWLTAPVVPLPESLRAELEEVEDLWFFETVTPTATPAAMRAMSVTREPMTYREGWCEREDGVETRRERD